MIRNYTILTTNGELQSSPYVKRIEKEYDIHLSTNQPKIVNFLFQLPILRSEVNNVRVLHDTDMLEITNLHVDCFSHQTLVTSTFLAKDIGSYTTSIYLPDQISSPTQNYNAKKVPTK